MNVGFSEKVGETLSSEQISCSSAAVVVSTQFLLVINCLISVQPLPSLFFYTDEVLPYFVLHVATLHVLRLLLMNLAVVVRNVLVQCTPAICPFWDPGKSHLLLNDQTIPNVFKGISKFAYPFQFNLCE